MKNRNNKQIEDAILLLTKAGVIQWKSLDPSKECGVAEANLHLSIIDMRGNEKSLKYEVLTVSPHVAKSDAVPNRVGVYRPETSTYIGFDTNKELITTVFGSDETAAQRRAEADKAEAEAEAEAAKAGK